MTATTTTTGHALSAAAWLDVHYLAGQAEYEAMLSRAGFQAGWRMLDAGCGGGSFLPLLAELLGPTGQVSAIDLAPENVERVVARTAAGQFRCPVDARTGQAGFAHVRHHPGPARDRFALAGAAAVAPEHRAGQGRQRPGMVEHAATVNALLMQDAELSAIWYSAGKAPSDGPSKMVRERHREMLVQWLIFQMSERRIVQAANGDGALPAGCPNCAKPVQSKFQHFTILAHAKAQRPQRRAISLGVLGVFA